MRAGLVSHARQRGLGAPYRSDRSTSHARAVASDVLRHCIKLPILSRTRILAEVFLAEADLRLAEPYQSTARCVRQRAHIVKALYERLDRLAPPVEMPAT